MIKQQVEQLCQGFTRQETLALAGISSNRLQYLERISLIKPRRVGASKKPTVLYSWEQIVAVRMLDWLAHQVPALQIREIIQFLEFEASVDVSTWDKCILLIGDNIFAIEADWSDAPQLLSELFTAEKIERCTLVVIPILKQVVREIWTAARQTRSIDLESFKQRAKAYG